MNQRTVNEAWLAWRDKINPPFPDQGRQAFYAGARAALLIPKTEEPRTFDDAWLAFRYQIGPLFPDRGRQAFYAGARAVLDLVRGLAEQDPPTDQRRAAMEAIEAEIRAFDSGGR